MELHSKLEKVIPWPQAKEWFGYPDKSERIINPLSWEYSGTDSMSDKALHLFYTALANLKSAPETTFSTPTTINEQKYKILKVLEKSSWGINGEPSFSYIDTVKQIHFEPKHQHLLQIRTEFNSIGTYAIARIARLTNWNYFKYRLLLKLP